MAILYRGKCYATEFTEEWYAAVSRLLRRDVHIEIRENVRTPRPAPWLWARRNGRGRVSSGRVLPHWSMEAFKKHD